MKRLTFILLLLLSQTSLFGQATTEGTDFWLGFMENEPFQDLALELYMSASDTAEVTIEAPVSGLVINRTVIPGSTLRVNMPLSLMPSGQGKFGDGIHVFSDNPISLYALNKRSFSADAAVILPTNALGKEYYVMAHIEPEEDRTPPTREAEFLVVATEDNTEIAITPSAETVIGWEAGVTQIITLNAGETYQVQSSDLDLTGSKVEVVGGTAGNCGKIAVFGGNKWTNVGGCGQARDHLLEQMFPVNTWGKNFLFVPYFSRQGGDYVKIVASEDNTKVTVEGVIEFTLDAGGYQIMETNDVKSLQGVRSIKSDKPIMVGQFSRSQDCDGVPSDPFMILVSPLEQRVNSVTFSAFNAPQIDTYYVTLITEKDGFGSVKLDGNEISNGFLSSGDAVYRSLSISQGDHTITSDNGVIAYVYGFGNAESFGYSAGVSLENLNLQIVGDDEFLDIIAEEACLGAEIDFTVDFEVPPGENPRFNTFEWDFGDGTILTGENVKYEYAVAGTYDIVLTASDGLGSCGNSETIIRTIEVLDIVVDDLEGPLSVCPDVDGIAYKAIGPDDNTYSWDIVGGTIVSESNNEIVVNWGASRNDAALILTPTNGKGCVGDPINYNVVINVALEPALPQADSPTDTEVCDLDRNSVRYFTPQTNGSEYEWFIEGGNITSDNSLNEIFVDWGSSSSGKIWYKEFNPLIANCEGFSDTLNVTIYPEILVQSSIQNVLCNGESNANIELSISGGKPGDYTVVWDNGAEGSILSNVPAGTYVATITDVLGCPIERTYEVTEPDVLEVTSDPQVLPVRCFQESNGEAIIVAQGGTTFPNGDYRYVISGDNGFSSTVFNGQITGLPAGNYTVRILDANDCETTTSFTIDEPALLEADLESLINDPICPDANDGVAFIDAKGGTPAYQFFWSNNPTVDDANASNLSEGSYSVRIVDSNGCETSFGIDVTERFPRIFIPNAFSPNGDRENETFKPVADCLLQFSIQIYNQWGSVIYSSEDVTEGWDGTFEGQDAPIGSYSYIIFYAGEINDIPFEETFRGTFKLIR